MVAAELIEPSGEIPADLFGTATETNVATWLERAETQAAAVSAELRDVATAAYAYHLAFGAKARQLASLPASYAEDGGSLAYGSHQIRHFQALAEQYLAEFRGYVAATATDPSPQSRPVSSSVRTVVVF